MDLQNPLVSIIIPVYNAEKYLQDCINSAINQTYKNKEIIIIDDGSTDQSLAIAKKFENENFKIIEQDNKGAAAARNLGINKAKGQFLQFLDADDFISVNKIEEQVNLLKNFPKHIGLCGTIYFDDGTNPKYELPIHEWYAEGSEDPINFIIKLYGGLNNGHKYFGMVQPNAWLIPKNIVKSVGPWNESLSVDDDGEYFCRVILNAKGIKYTYNAINYYRKYQNFKNLSAQTNYKGYKSMLKANDLKYEYLKDKVSLNYLNKIFSNSYQQIVTSSYPKYKILSIIAKRRAEKHGLKKIKYIAGPLSTKLSILIGWKLIRILNYLRFK